MKILTVIGARPQFIKAAVLSREISRTAGVSEVIVHTGQHFDDNMSRIFFDEMEIPNPDYNLEINSMSHGKMTGRMLQSIEAILFEEKPDAVLVYGDTNSTLAGALAASKLQIKLCHVEAGLRSYNRAMPEEINRILTDVISDQLFCPTQTAVNNLIQEGIDSKKFFLTGDVMYDAMLHYLPKARKPEIELPDKYLLATVHRSENTDDPRKLNDIFSALNKLSAQVPVLLPIHPRTAQKVDKDIFSNITYFEPVGYFELLYLLQHCSLVLTDSGGLQKEACLMQKPCITMREQTEWIELVETGVNILTGSNETAIIENTCRLLSAPPEFPQGLYGDGSAGKKILQLMK